MESICSFSFLEILKESHPAIVLETVVIGSVIIRVLFQILDKMYILEKYNFVNLWVYIYFRVKRAGNTCVRQKTRNRGSDTSHVLIDWAHLFFLLLLPTTGRIEEKITHAPDSLTNSPKALKSS